MTSALPPDSVFVFWATFDGFLFTDDYKSNYFYLTFLLLASVFILSSYKLSLFSCCLCICTLMCILFVVLFTHRTTSAVCLRRFNIYEHISVKLALLLSALIVTSNHCNAQTNSVSSFSYEQSLKSSNYHSELSYIWAPTVNFTVP